MNSFLKPHATRILVFEAEQFQKNFRLVISLLFVWIGMAMPVSGNGVVSAQAATSRFYFAPVPEANTLVTEDGGHEGDMYRVQDLNGRTVGMVKLPADLQQQGQQSSFFTLHLQPPNGEKSGAKANEPANDGVNDLHDPWSFAGFGKMVVIVVLWVIVLVILLPCGMYGGRCVIGVLEHFSNGGTFKGLF